MIKLKDLITEQKYEYGCVMLYFNFPEMQKLHEIIDSNDIFNDTDKRYGLETEPHVTLLFGLHEGVSVDDVKSVLNKFIYPKCVAYNPSAFNNPEYDVLKFDVKGPNLFETNKALKSFPYTSDFPDYHPHMTIGYLKPGTASKYFERLGGKSYDLLPSRAIYSQPSGKKTTIKIKKT